jgi:hypothetical protein
MALRVPLFHGKELYSLEGEIRYMCWDVFLVEAVAKHKRMILASFEVLTKLWADDPGEKDADKLGRLSLGKRSILIGSNSTIDSASMLLDPDAHFFGAAFGHL